MTKLRRPGYCLAAIAAMPFMSGCGNHHLDREWVVKAWTGTHAEHHKPDGGDPKKHLAIDATLTLERVDSLNGDYLVVNASEGTHPREAWIGTRLQHINSELEDIINTWLGSAQEESLANNSDDFAPLMCAPHCAIGNLYLPDDDEDDEDDAGEVQASNADRDCNSDSDSARGDNADRDRPFRGCGSEIHIVILEEVDDEEMNDCSFDIEHCMHIRILCASSDPIDSDTRRCDMGVGDLVLKYGNIGDGYKARANDPLDPIHNGAGHSHPNNE